MFPDVGLCVVPGMPYDVVATAPPDPAPSQVVSATLRADVKNLLQPSAELTLDPLVQRGRLVIQLKHKKVVKCQLVVGKLEEIEKSTIETSAAIMNELAAGLEARPDMGKEELVAMRDRLRAEKLGDA